MRLDTTATAVDVDEFISTLQPSLIQGNVEAADKIDIKKEAKLVGDIKTSRIGIEDGAYFKGSIDIVKADAAKPAQPRPQAAVATAAYVPVSSNALK